MAREYKEDIYMGVAPVTRINATNVYMADGSTLQKQADKKFELIETITLTEDTSIIERTTEPDTTPYNFESVIITAEMAQSDNNRNMRISINNDGISFAIYRARVTNSTSYSIAKILKKANLIDFSSAYSTTASGISNPVVLCTPYMVNAVNITSITMTMLADVIPTGSVIKIYAVRA